MALFNVDRFMGDDDDDDDDTVEAVDPNRARNILAKLQAQAAARKLSLHTTQHNKLEGKRKHIKTSEGSSSKSKKRRVVDKSSESDDSDVRIGDDTDSKVAHEKKKKKKKHKENNETEPQLESPAKKERKLSRRKNKDSSEVKDTESDDVSDPVSMVPLGEGDQEIGGFTVLGDFKKKEKQQVSRVLPEWLSSPNVISADLRTKRLPIRDLSGLDEDLIARLSENNITHFFPVQMQVIPELLKIARHGCMMGPGGYTPSDICVSAPTGSGKTLAFVLPIVQALRSRVVRKVRAVVVLPVKDLAVQVYKVFQTYVRGTDLKVGLAVGQKSVSNEQLSLVMKRLQGRVSLVDILVATPGRLVDHIKKTEGFDLSQLRFLVIDEADRMMDDIKQDWLATLEGAVYNQDGCCLRNVPGPLTVANCSRIQIPLQKLLFSATLSQNPEKLQHVKLFQPRLFTSVARVSLQEEKKIGRLLTGGHDTELDATRLNEEKIAEDETKLTAEFVGKYTTPMGLTEYFVRASAAEKPLLVLHFLHQLKFRHVLCFTNSREATHRLHLLVKEFGDIRVREFSSNLPAKMRNKIINDFSSGKVDVLICSDALARGMDVIDVKYVVSYDTTTHIKTYIHRVGRTARAGKVGTAITLLENKEVYHFKKMVLEAGKKDIKEMDVHPDKLSPLVSQFQVALRQLPGLLMEEKRKKKQKG